jgi:hypothetical protein
VRICWGFVNRKPVKSSRGTKVPERFLRSQQVGDLIVMTRSKSSIRREAPQQGSASVLFFTGVRYTRIPDVDQALASVTPPRRATKPRRGPSKNGDMKRA